MSLIVDSCGHSWNSSTGERKYLTTIACELCCLKYALTRQARSWMCFYLHPFELIKLWLLCLLILISFTLFANTNVKLNLKALERSDTIWFHQLHATVFNIYMNYTTIFLLSFFYFFFFSTLTFLSHFSLSFVSHFSLIFLLILFFFFFFAPSQPFLHSLSSPLLSCPILSCPNQNGEKC